jgi:uncharacterized protein (DUF1330 family)
MSPAYVVGQLTVKDADKWAQYRERVPATIAPWGGELVFRGTQHALWSGANPHPDIVVIRFPDAAAADNWFHSAAYQALIPLRQQAADVVLMSYQS